MFIHSALSLALVALVTGPLSAQGLPHPGPREGHPSPLFMMRGLDLTESQKASLKAIGDKHREATKAQHESAEAAMKAFHEAMQNPASTVDQLKALHDKASQTQFELALDRRAMMQESLAVLTPEQRAKAEKLRAEGPKGGHRGPGPRHGMPPQGPAPEPK